MFFSRVIDREVGLPYYTTAHYGVCVMCDKNNITWVSILISVRRRLQKTN